MTRVLPRLRSICLRHWLVWLLVLALPAHGVSNVLLQVMGATHRHSAVVQRGATVDATHDAAHDPSHSAPSLTARATLRSLVASVAGPGALHLIDTMHAREHAWQHAAERKAHPFAERAGTADAHAADAHQNTHQHAHDTFQRHSHAPQDDSVVALGAQTLGPDAAGSTPALDAGGGTFPLAPALAIQAAPLTDAHQAWRHALASDWRSHVTLPLERPPQA